MSNKLSTDARLNTLVRDAFDSHAFEYDTWFSEKPLALDIRRRTWQVMDRFFDAGNRVLDLGCGTGEDAIHLARRGVYVRAVDVSSAMLNRLEEKARSLKLDRFIDYSLADGRFLDFPEGEFDGIYSNFGVLNCVADLDWLPELAGRSLKPGRRMILVTMGRCYPLEIAVNLAKGRFRPALRRFRSPAFAIVGGVRFSVHYHRFSILKEALKGNFVLEHREGLGLLVPVPGLEHLDQRFPRMFRALKPIDSRLARWAPTSTMGDHVLSVWRYRGS